VADHLANLNYQVHLADKYVGPRCVVVWRHRKGGVHNGGGGQQFYSGTTRDANPAGFPLIAVGMDIQAIENVLIPHMLKRLEVKRTGQPAPDPNWDEINAELARLPDKPDESLR